MKITRAFRASLTLGIHFLSLGVGDGFAEELISLDEPTPGASVSAPAAPVAEEEVSLDLGGAPTFNPYVFARTDAWGLLPVGALILVGLHLLRVPKRKSSRKIDQARRFFPEGGPE